jgi:ketosteroid isomerase-like protein
MLRGASWLCFSLAVLSAAAVVVSVSAQGRDNASSALERMVAAERAFAQRATVVGWKQAFIEYFADDAVAFAGNESAPAKEGLRQAPDPPRDLQLLWEPRWGDAAASGELGYLTGPSTNINPARNNGAPRYGNYASIWKRQTDGSYKVLIDVGVNLPSEPPFAPGFTRAPSSNRYTGTDTIDAARRALSAADAELDRLSATGQASGYQGRLAEGVRLHRFGVMPIVGITAATAWLRAQPPYTSGDSRFAEVAASRDLGYTWGTYTLAASANTQSEQGFYVRAWIRVADGSWAVALDVTQPQ